jgi:hypothetical protein
MISGGSINVVNMQDSGISRKSKSKLVSVSAWVVYWSVCYTHHIYEFNVHIHITRVTVNSSFALFTFAHKSKYYNINYSLWSYLTQHIQPNYLTSKVVPEC